LDAQPTGLGHAVRGAPDPNVRGRNFGGRPLWKEQTMTGWRFLCRIWTEWDQLSLIPTWEKEELELIW